MAISGTILVDLPAEQSFTYDEFINAQTRSTRKQGSVLAVKNEEVRRAVNELVDLVRLYPRENNQVTFPNEDADLFRRHYSKLMYQAILAATRASFTALKHRLGSKSSGAFMFLERPFFDVDVELKVPDVVMQPSLEEIQGAINTTAK